MGLDADIALQPLADGVFAGTLSDGWQVVRGPLGGYVAAILVRGMSDAVADRGRQLRSLTVHFLRAPRPGDLTVRTVVERAGRKVTALSGRIEQDGRPVVLGLATFSAPWGGRRHDASPMPDVAPPDAAEAPPVLPDPPPFAARMVMQSRFGPPPLSGGDRAETGGWLGLREERPLDAAAVVLLADAWFPAPFPLLDVPSPAPTLDLTVHLRAPLPRDDRLLLGRFRTRLVRDGFFEEDGELWAPDGTLVAQCRQLALLIEP